MRLIMWSFFVCLACMVNLVAAQVREGKGKDVEEKTQTESDLTEGLLDLLGDPGKSSESNGEETASKVTPDIASEFDGEDIGQNPLVAIQREMIMAGNYLDSRMPSEKTEAIQSSILNRLDELIQQAEQKEQEERQQKGQANQRSTSQTQQQQGIERQRSQLGESEQSGDDDSEKKRSGSPGQTGAASEVVVQPNDPRALQQNVWGQLPERVRKQMQSRMVERFLPSYQKQIEAYFRALLKERQ